MNTNENKPTMNVEDYEDMAVKKSNTTKRVATGAALFAGGAAIAGGSAYAATRGTEDPEEVITVEDVKGGANVASTYEEEVKEVQEVQVVHHHHHIEVVEPQPEPEPDVQWTENTEYYIGDEKVASIEEGVYEGHQFALVDVDADNHADYLAVDLNDNGQYENNEIVRYSVDDHVHMGHETAHTTEQHYETLNFENTPGYDQVQNDDDNIIYNDFHDEKSNDVYNGDYAQNNPDYNSNANTGNYSASMVTENEHESNNIVDFSEENHLYAADGDDPQTLPTYGETEYEPASDYTADAGENVLATGAEDNYIAEADNSTVDSGSSYDDMMGGEEFIG